MPWQTGMTGLLVDKAEAPDIKSVNDLFDPKYKGKVTVLTEMRDTVPLMLKADGIDPAEATKEEWLAEIEKLQDAVDSGQLRRFTGNDYVQDLTNGNVVASIGWSGDASIVENADVEWRMPTDGCILWSDNMVIPVGAPNTGARWRGWTSSTTRRSRRRSADYIRYVTRSRASGPGRSGAGRRPAGLPAEEFTENCTTQPNPPGETPKPEVTAAFQDVVTG